MKKILIAASVVGAAAAGVALYMKNKNRASKDLGDVKESLNDAYNDMDKHLYSVERKTEGLLS